MADFPVSAPAPSELPLVARLTPWFWKRSLVLLAVLVGLGLYFLYDGLIGYPKKNAKLEAGIEKRAQIWAGAGTEQDKNRAWSEYTRGVGLADKDGEKELREQWKSPAKVREQLYCAAGLGVVALGLGIWQLRQRGRSLELRADGLRLPDGELVPFASMQRIDRRKWHRGKAGLAYLFYQSGGQTRRATIDGLKYGGFRSDDDGRASLPERIMAGLLAHEHIELLDFASQIETEEAGPGDEEGAAGEERSASDAAGKGSGVA